MIILNVALPLQGITHNVYKHLHPLLKSILHTKFEISAYKFNHIMKTTQWMAGAVVTSVLTRTEQLKLNRGKFQCIW